jgi:hypothetical protein
MFKSLSEKILVLFAGLYGLWVCAPGFRPKHLRDITVGLIELRGWALLLFFVVIALLIPAASRLKRMQAISTVLGGVFSLLAVLLAVDLFFSLTLLKQEIAIWPVRFAYLLIAAWGLADFSGFQSTLRAASAKLKNIWIGFRTPLWKLFFCLIFFFLVRQELHFYITKTAPMGDELFWWWRGSVAILDQGIAQAMILVAYTPGIPWLISLPARLVGSHNSELLYAYPLAIFMGYLWLIFELAESSEALLAGIAAFFFVFLNNRDLAHDYGALFYGEAIAALLVALVIVELQSQKQKMAWLGTGLLLSFAALSKPPISFFCLPVALVSAAAWMYRSKDAFVKKASQAAFLVGAVFVSQTIWKRGLTALGRTFEYSVSLKDIFAKPIRVDIPWHMFLGCFNPGTPQFAYTMGLVGVFVMLALQKSRRQLQWFAALIVLYWGFVFGLYATIWQNGELGSAGRYISHAAIACILLLPLAFSKNYALRDHHPVL